MVDLVVFSDRQKGLLMSIKEKLSRATQRNCIVHIVRNMAANRNIPKLTDEQREEIYLGSKSTNTTELFKHMGYLFMFNYDAFEYLSKIDPYLWTNVESEKSTYGYTSSSTAEAFNSLMRCKKSLPFPIFLKCIINWSNKIINQRRERYNNRVEEYNETAIEYISSLKSDYITVDGDISEKQEYAVVIDNSVQIIIHPLTGKCECGRWQNTKLPCRHLKAIIQNRYNSTDLITNYIHEMYKTSYIKRIYENIYNPYIPNKRMMQTKIDEPKYNRKSLKRKRIKGADEISKKKK